MQEEMRRAIMERDAKLVCADCARGKERRGPFHIGPDPQWCSAEAIWRKLDEEARGCRCEDGTAVSIVMRCPVHGVSEEWTHWKHRPT